MSQPDKTLKGKIGRLGKVADNRMNVRTTQTANVSEHVSSLRLPDIKPQSRIARLQREKYQNIEATFPVSRVAPLTGMSPAFIHKVCGKKDNLSVQDVLLLLDQDAFGETIVPRSMVLDYLLSKPTCTPETPIEWGDSEYLLIRDNALDKIATLPRGTIRCVVTSTPYWGTRLYKEHYFVKWSDGEVCPYGHEQTPEGFARHTAEILLALYDVLTEDGSIWWNIMDTYNTRTQIRNNAAEALRAMQGKDDRGWRDHECRRYSAGHAYLKDGEQCLIPSLIAERASRIGYYVKSVITWAKPFTLPEPQQSRVSRSLEYILHLTKVRTPYFNKEAYRSLPASLGGRNNDRETDKLSDVWVIPTSQGKDAHGAQFPIALPARCIALSTRPGDVVLDPFVGAGNSGVAALALGRKFIGIDVCQDYLNLAERRMSSARRTHLQEVMT